MKTETTYGVIAETYGVWTISESGLSLEEAIEVCRELIRDTHGGNAFVVMSAAAAALSGADVNEVPYPPVWYRADGSAVQMGLEKIIKALGGFTYQGHREEALKLLRFLSGCDNMSQFEAGQKWGFLSEEAFHYDIPMPSGIDDAVRNRIVYESRIGWQEVFLLPQKEVL